LNKVLVSSHFCHLKNSFTNFHVSGSKGLLFIALLLLFIALLRLLFIALYVNKHIAARGPFY